MGKTLSARGMARAALVVASYPDAFASFARLGMATNGAPRLRSRRGCRPFRGASDASQVTPAKHMICNECFGVTFGRFSGAADYCANPSFKRTPNGIARWPGRIA